MGGWRRRGRVSVSAALGDGAAAGSGREWAHVAAGVPLGAVWALVAAALGALTRSTAVALTTVRLWRFVAEQVIPLAAQQPELRRACSSPTWWCCSCRRLCSSSGATSPERREILPACPQGCPHSVGSGACRRSPSCGLPDVVRRQSALNTPAAEGDAAGSG